ASQNVPLRGMRVSKRIRNGRIQNCPKKFQRRGVGQWSQYRKARLRRSAHTVNHGAKTPGSTLDWRLVQKNLWSSTLGAADLAPNNFWRQVEPFQRRQLVCLDSSTEVLKSFDRTLEPVVRDRFDSNRKVW